MIENQGFKQLLQTMDPRAPIPSRNYLRNETLVSYYHEVKGTVREIMEGASRHAITTDLWTSSGNEDYLTITAHMISNDFDMHAFVLQTRNMSERHTAENLQIEFEKAKIEWKLVDPFSVTDNAKNITNTFEKFLKWDHLGCMAHTINLSVSKCFKVTQVARLLGKCRRVVSHFRRSPLQNKYLHEKQTLLSLPTHSLIIDVETRWNSTHDMVERLLQQEPAICAVLLNSEKRDDRQLTFSDDEVKNMRSLVNILKPLKSATVLVGAEKSPTSSRMYPVLLKLKKHLAPVDQDNNFCKEMKQVMLNDLESRHKSDSDQRFMKLACLVDPRCKDLGFLSSEDVEFTKELLKTECTILENKSNEPNRDIMIKVEPEVPDQQANHDQFADAANANPPLPNLPSLPSASADPIVKSEPKDVGPSCSPPASKKSKPSPEPDFLSDIIITRVQAPQPFHEKIEIELKAYLNEPSIELNMCPLAWWKAKGHLYPNIATVARRTLCVPATSVPSERIFSAAGFCSDKRRSNLAPENLDMLIFLNKNLKV